MRPAKTARKKSTGSIEMTTSSSIDPDNSKWSRLAAGIATLPIELRDIILLQIALTVPCELAVLSRLSKHVRTLLFSYLFSNIHLTNIMDVDQIIRTATRKRPSRKRKTLEAEQVDENRANFTFIHGTRKMILFQQAFREQCLSQDMLRAVNTINIHYLYQYVTPSCHCDRYLNLLQDICNREAYETCTRYAMELVKLANQDNGLDPRRVKAIAMTSLHAKTFESSHLFICQIFPLVSHFIMDNSLVDHYCWFEPGHFGCSLEKGRFEMRWSRGKLPPYMPQERIVLPKMLMYGIRHDCSSHELISLAGHMPNLKHLYIFFPNQHGDDSDRIKQYQNWVIPAWPSLRLIICIRMVFDPIKYKAVSLKKIITGEVTFIDGITIFARNESKPGLRL